METRHAIVDDQRFYVRRLFLLRWSLLYADGRRRFGMWSNDSMKASRQPVDGLLRASVEVRGLIDGHVYSVAECDGADFVEFRWHRCFGVPIGLISDRDPAYDSVTGTGQIHGLMLVSRSERMLVRVDGTAKVQANGRTTEWKDVVSGSLSPSSRSRPR